MTKDEYIEQIKQMCIDAGTYATYFDRIIFELAELLVIKDDAQRQYIASGGKPVVKHTNKAKQENIVKNPALVVILECKATALAYWRDLGLTPKGLKSLGETIKKEENNSFEDLLSNLGI